MNIDFKARHAKITKAREEILDHLSERFKSGDMTVLPGNRDYKNGKNSFTGSGTLLCPVCGVGTLSYSRAAYNGHVHANCETDGCVRWME
jgi:hypothetical protein